MTQKLSTTIGTSDITTGYKIPRQDEAFLWFYELKGASMPPSMQTIANNAKQTLENLVPYLSVITSDNLGASVSIRGSFDKKETWNNGIFYNSKHFRFDIQPKTKLYNENDQVSVTLETKHHNLPKFRKFTGTPEMCIDKIHQRIFKVNDDSAKTS